MLLAEPKRICSADDPTWKERRQEGIGASESAAACGVSPWETPRELYHRKRGELPATEENFAMRFGLFAEPFIEQEFQSRTGLTIQFRQPGLYCHPEMPWILATPDDVLDPQTGLELKTIGDRRAWDVLGEEYTDEVPIEWNVQAHQQMLVMGFQSVYFAVLVGGSDLKIYEVQRHEKVIQRVAEKVSDLWDRIVNGVPPEMEDHPNNLQMVRELYRDVETGSIVTLSDDAAEAWSRFESNKDIIKAFQAQSDKYKARVLLELGENEAGRLPDGRFIRRKVVTKAEYTVKAQSYVDVRAVSGKGY